MTATGDSEALRARVRVAVGDRGASAVARQLGVSRGGLLSYLNGTCQAGTEALIREHASSLTTESGTSQ